MNTVLILSAFGLASYLLGAIPCGYLIARSRGVDLFRTGSGSTGATNVFRSVGRTAGVVTFFLDVLKGFVASFFFTLAAVRMNPEVSREITAIVCACAAVMGHNWPVYLGFRGGKGIATSGGAILGIAPPLFGIGLLTWVVMFLLTRYVSVASLLTTIALVTSGWVLYMKNGLVLPVAFTMLGIFALWRHRSNVARLIQGTEHRFEFRKKTDAQP